MPKNPVPHNIFDGFSFFLSLCGIILLLFLTSFNINSYLNHKVVLGIEKDLTVEEHEWEQMTKDYPNYKDAWIGLIDIQIEMGKIKEAQNSFEKLKKIDPNSSEVKRLKNYFSSGVSASVF